MWQSHVEIEDYSVGYFEYYSGTELQGRPGLIRTLHAFVKRVWAPPLVEVQWYSISDVAMHPKMQQNIFWSYTRLSHIIICICVSYDHTNLLFYPHVSYWTYLDLLWWWSRHGDVSLQENQGHFKTFQEEAISEESRVWVIVGSWRQEIGGSQSVLIPFLTPLPPSCTPSNSVYPFRLQSGSVQPTEVTDCEHTLPPCGGNQLPCQ